MQRLFEAPAIGKMSPMAKIFAYTLLGFGRFSSCFQFTGCYYVIQGYDRRQSGTFLYPFVDFQPTLEAWRVQFSEDPYCTVSAIGRQLWLLVYNSAVF